MIARASAFDKILSPVDWVCMLNCNEAHDIEPLVICLGVKKIDINNNVVLRQFVECRYDLGMP